MKNASPLVTEEEARTRICCGPPAQAAILSAIAGLLAVAVKAMINPPKTPQDLNKMHLATTCLGSKCMAWRWAEFDEDKGCCGIARAKAQVTPEQKS
jgi:hypothetical protein